MKRIVFKNFDQVLKAIEKIESENRTINDSWNINQHFIHCGQAINYSMNGYPIVNHVLLQHTIGKSAFYLFKWKGYMNHNTNELTPGSPPIDANTSVNGLNFIKTEIIDFINWSDTLKPHQFYGKLSKKETELAHSMHIANHFECFED